MKPAPLQEAATLKTLAQRLARDMHLLLQERNVPARLRKEIEDVRAELKRTWADLEMDAAAEVAEVIRQEGTEIVLRSKDGTKVLGRFPFGRGRKYKGKKEATMAAQKRERQVQYFKHQGESADQEPAFTYAGESLPLTEIGLRILDEMQLQEQYKPPPGWNDPKSWLSSKKGADTVRGAAWRGMGSSMTSCMEHMAGKVDDTAKFCAALKDAVKGTTKWRGRESAEEDGPNLSEHMDAPVGANPVVYGATSFADLDAAENAQDAAQEVSHRTWQFQVIIGNIMADTTLEDKAAAIESAASEFVTIIKETLASPTEEPPQTEAAAEAALGEGESRLLESESGAALAIVEEAASDNGARAPVTVNFAMIKPGAGNKNDRHWYPPDVLKRDAHVFEGADIFVTDHKDNERSERTKVGKVQAITGFTDDGAPIARTILFDPGTAEKTRNRARAGELATLECSILGNGVAKSKDIGGEQYNVVEAITRGLALELVSKAGAGGHALNIAESAEGANSMGSTTGTPAFLAEAEVTRLLTASTLPETFRELLTARQYKDEAELRALIEKTVDGLKKVSPPAPTFLAEAEVTRLVTESKLPKPVAEFLVERQYKDEAELRQALATAAERLKQLTGSGQPFGLGSTTPPAPTQMSEADYDKEFKELYSKYGIALP